MSLVVQPIPLLPGPGGHELRDPHSADGEWRPKPDLTPLSFGDTIATHPPSSDSPTQDGKDKDDPELGDFSCPRFFEGWERHNA